MCQCLLARSVKSYNERAARTTEKGSHVTCFDGSGAAEIKRTSNTPPEEMGETAYRAIVGTARSVSL